MAQTFSITQFALHLVKTNRAKDATTAGKRVRSALRANKPAMAKVDANIKKHQKGASYMPLNTSSAKILADALNITLSDLNKGKRTRKPAKKNTDNVVVTPDATPSA